MSDSTSRDNRAAVSVLGEERLERTHLLHLLCPQLASIQKQWQTCQVKETVQLKPHKLITPHKQQPPGAVMLGRFNGVNVHAQTHSLGGTKTGSCSLLMIMNKHMHNTETRVKHIHLTVEQDNVSQDYWRTESGILKNFIPFWNIFECT